MNLSVRSLIDLDFAGQLHALCRGHGVEPSVLVLEITETQMMADPARTIRMLERLATLGIEFSVDDFGTGYSSPRTCSGSRYTRSRSTSRSCSA